MRKYVVLAFLACTELFGQGQVNSGELKGTVLDPTNGPIRDARIVLADTSRGLVREARTDETGEYRIPILLPGLYVLRVEAQGFSTKVHDGVEIRLGEITTIRSDMQVGAVATEIVVDAEPPVVETERTQQSTTIDSQRLRNLPINRRNYLDFALLTPGVAETNHSVDGTDFRVVQAPHSGLSFGGSNGRGNAFSIDGVENIVNSGGVRPAVSQEIVREFQVNQNSYLAELGGASGGVINVVTKSGSNQFHGNIFGYLRHRDIQARNFFDPTKSAFTRTQSGLTLGGPVRRDRTFFFAGVEHLARHETAFVPILQDRSAFGRLTSSQQSLTDFFDATGNPQFRAISGAMKAALVTNNYPQTLRLFNANSGAFPFSERNTQVSARLDHKVNERDNLFVRAGYTSGLSANAQFGALFGFNRGRSIDLLDGSLLVNNTLVINSRWVSETRLMFGAYNFDVIPTDRTGPEINITGFGLFGREIFLPAKTIERHYQAQETLSHHSGRHSARFGVDVNPVSDRVRSETFFSGRFSFGESVPLGAVLNSALRDPNAATALGATLVNLGQPRLDAALSAPISAIQAYNLGLPTFYQQGFGDPNWRGWSKRSGYFAQDSFRLRPNLTLIVGARYDLEINPREVRTDRNNIAPRVGFAWSPGKGGNTVLRGGFGIFFAQTNAQVANLPGTLDGKQIAQIFVPLSGAPGLNNPATGRPLTSADIYQTLAAQGVIGKRPIELGDLAQFRASPGPNSPFAVLFGITPDFKSASSQHASFEIERGWGRTAFSASYTMNRGANIVRSLDRNLFYRGRTAENQPVFGFYNPLVFQNNILESTGNSFYHAATFEVTRRFSRHHSIHAHYTFSKAIDEVTDFNSDFQPHDQLNARADRALSAFHQKHRLVANAVIESPWRSEAGQPMYKNILANFILSPIVIVSSGRPFNVLAGFDNLGDRHPNTHRPFNAGRNIGRGPAYASFDLRITRRFYVRESRALEFAVDGFNILNHTNFATVNNTVGDVRLELLPTPLVGFRGVPTQPLAFSSAFDPRQFQISLKYIF